MASLEPEDSARSVQRSRPRWNVAALATDIAMSLADAELSDEEDDGPHESALAAYASRPVSLPGKGGTPFVPTAPRSSGGSRTKAPRATNTAFGRNQGGRERSSREDGGRRRSGPTKEPLPLPAANASKQDIEVALKSRNICFFHARGLQCPFQESGCRFSHDEDDLAFGFYENTVDHDKSRATQQTSMDMIVAYRLTSGGPTVEDDSAETSE